MRQIDIGNTPQAVCAVILILQVVNGTVSPGPLVEWWRPTAFQKEVVIPSPPAGLRVTILLRLTNWRRQLYVFTGIQTAVKGHIQFRYEIAVDTIFMSYKKRFSIIVTAVWTVCTFFFRKLHNCIILLTTHIRVYVQKKIDSIKKWEFSKATLEKNSK